MGQFGLQVTEPYRLKDKTIAAMLLQLNREVKEVKGEVYRKCFPHIPVTSKALGLRMGKGKGAVDHFVDRVRPGRVVFEIGNVSSELAYKILARVSNLIGAKTQVIEAFERPTPQQKFRPAEPELNFYDYINRPMRKI